MNVYRHTILPEAVAGHKHTSVVFHHAPSVTINVVQRQHDPHPYGAFPHVVFCHNRRLFRRDIGLCDNSRRCLSLRIGNENKVTFLQLIPRLLHLRIGFLQVLDGYSVVFGNAKDCLFPFYLVHFFPFCRLADSHIGNKQSRNKQRETPET